MFCRHVFCGDYIFSGHTMTLVTLPLHLHHDIVLILYFGPNTQSKQNTKPRKKFKFWGQKSDDQIRRCWPTWWLCATLLPHGDLSTGSLWPPLLRGSLSSCSPEDIIQLVSLDIRWTLTNCFSWKLNFQSRRAACLLRNNATLASLSRGGLQ